MGCSRLLTCLVVVCSLGCSTYKPVTDVAPQDLVEAKKPGTVLVTTVSGDKLLVSQPIIRDGALMGERFMGLRPARPVAIPLDSIRVIEIRQMHAELTAIAVLISALAAAALVFFATHEPFQ